MKTLLVLLVLGLSASLSQCTTPQWIARFFLVDDAPATTVEFDTALYERGISVYRSQYCGSCHTLSAANTRGILAPNHDAAALSAAQQIALPGYTGSATTVEDYLRESLLEPEAYRAQGFELTNHHMPAYVHLPPQDIDALVYMLAQQQ